MTNYNEYLNFNDGIYKENQDKIIGKIKIDDDIKRIIKNTKNIKLTVFAEPYCPDCRALVAVLENIVKINNGIDIEYISREGNLEKLKEISSEARIPTIILNNEVVFVEFPNAVKNIMKNSISNFEILHDYRIGKYNDKIIESIVEIIK